MSNIADVSEILRVLFFKVVTTKMPLPIIMTNTKFEIGGNIAMKLDTLLSIY